MSKNVIVILSGGEPIKETFPEDKVEECLHAAKRRNLKHVQLREGGIYGRTLRKWVLDTGGVRWRRPKGTRVEGATGWIEVTNT